MERLVIRGGYPLSGSVEISGGKNAVLPMLAAAALFREPCRLERCPGLTDVETAMEILRALGASAVWDGTDILVDPRKISRWEIPEDLTLRMRGSVLFAGAMLARFGICRMTQPGGCILGARPLDFHRAGFEALGAVQDFRNPDIWHGPLTGAEIRLPYPSVGATENLILAALGARGTTKISGAAREPEIVCLCDFLRLGGCGIEGDGTDSVTVTGGFPGCASMAPIPDRMEAATFACCAASAGGRIFLHRAQPDHLAPVLEVLSKAGCTVRIRENGIDLENRAVKSPGTVVTGPYPGFPTDAQPPVMAALLRTEGITRIRETVFSDRLAHLEAFRQMGADILQQEHQAVIHGVPELRGIPVAARDLRGGAALAAAALGASGETSIQGLQYILRGYENFAGKLRILGAHIFPA